MSTNRSRRIDRDTAEQLLGGDAVGAPGGTGALSRLLDAAAAPAAEHELAGEEAAVAAFREAARLGPSRPTLPAQRSRPMAACAPRRVPGRRLGARAAVAAIAVTALGGVAVAAGGGMPALLGGDEPAALPAQSTAVSASVAVSSGARHSGLPTAGQAPQGSGAGKAPGASGWPSSARPGSSADTPADPSDQAVSPAPLSADSAAAMALLCGLWPKDGPATLDPRFEPLTRAAGGSDRVRALCASLGRPIDGNGTPSAAASSDSPGNANGGGQGGRKSAKPTVKATDQDQPHGQSTPATPAVPAPVTSTPAPAGPTAGRTPGDTGRTRPAEDSGGVGNRQ
ncbi:hypothetical protein ACFYNO_21330 [Kitasatospora sp. NPDC006697]|uniref:hypothetical protein n=1 Tax=Kitasatospora sp. NPDC006697 TaxID=3364020 RepID=UPI0036B3550B